MTRSAELSIRPGTVSVWRNRLLAQMKSTFKRHGTLNLFAALNVATGAIRSKTTATKKRPDFQAFLDELVAEVPVDREIHVILDNYCTHKKNDDRLAATSMSASTSCLLQSVA